MSALGGFVSGAVIGSYTGIGSVLGGIAGGVLGSSLSQSLGRVITGTGRVKPTTALLKKLYHMTFEAQTSRGWSWHSLLNNPENIDMNETPRVNVTQTLGGAYVEDFGAGLPIVTISGTTGYSSRYSTEGLYLDGFEAFILFRRVVRSFTESKSKNDVMNWYNWEDGEAYQIQPLDFKMQRSVRQPLLYRYEFKFTCTRRRGSVFNLLDSLLADPIAQGVSSLLGGSVSGAVAAVGLLGASKVMTGSSTGASLRAAGASAATKLAAKGISQ